MAGLPERANRTVLRVGRDSIAVVPAWLGGLLASFVAREGRRPECTIRREVVKKPLGNARGPVQRAARPRTRARVRALPSQRMTGAADTHAAGPRGVLAGDDLDVCPPPFRHNPSAWRQRVPIALLAMVAFAASVWLALYQWRLVPQPWDPFFGPASTAAVLDSDVSHRMRRWIGAPDAALGAIAYLGDAVFGLAGSTRRWQYRPWMVLLFGLDVIPLGIVSAVLVVLQGAVIGHWCTLCLITAAVSLVLVVLAWDEVRATCGFLLRVWRASRSVRVLWDVFWGRHHEVAARVALARSA